MPLIVTISIGKLIIFFSRLLGRGGGSALPGLVAERLDPDVARKLARRIPHGSIVVTGTNGKTTTSKMLARILTDHGERLVVNTAGSNLSRGVVSALIEHSNLAGEFSQTMGLFEVDEAAMQAVCMAIKPNIIVVLNIFRDQLDRYGELDTTAKLIGAGMAATKAECYLNADDPLVASLATYCQADRVHFFGIADAPIEKLAHDVTADSDTCPVCGQALVYRTTFYGHIGHYHCKNGDFTRPKPAYQASAIRLQEDSASTRITTPAQSFAVELQLPGLYNIYNALAAAAVADSLDVRASGISHSLHGVQAAFGRVEKLKVDGKDLYVLLVKNPTGFNQIIQTFLMNKKQQHMLICINDNFADGRDVSWLWDVAFEELAGREHHISVSGTRCNDMALRLKYAELSVDFATSDLSVALNQFVTQLPEGHTGYIIPTYTAMLALRQRLGTMTSLKGVWE